METGEIILTAWTDIGGKKRSPQFLSGEPYTDPDDAMDIVGSTLLDLLEEKEVDLSYVKQVVDIGCRNGLVIRGLSDNNAFPNATYIGVDADSSLQENWALVENPNVHFVRGDGNVLPLPNESADLVIVTNLLDQFFGVYEDEDGEGPEITLHKDFFSEIARVLKPGAILYCSDANTQKAVSLFEALGLKQVTEKNEKPTPFFIKGNLLNI